MPVSVRNFVMVQTKPIHSPMPMNIGRTPYYNDVPPQTEQPVRISGTKTMTLTNVTHTNKAETTTIRLNNPDKIHEFHPVRHPKPITLTNITNNDKSSVKIISSGR